MEDCKGYQTFMVGYHAETEKRPVLTAKCDSAETFNAIEGKKASDIYSKLVGMPVDLENRTDVLLCLYENIVHEEGQLIVARKNPETKSVDIIHGFKGTEANDIYKKLFNL